MSKKAYAICRTQKLFMADLGLAFAHNQRTVTLSNADPARKDRNIDLLAHDGLTPMQRWEDRMERCGNPRVRANAVVGIEKFYGYSPEATWIDPVEWATACADFERKYFGEANVVSLVLHMDEKSPHMQAVSIPMVRKSVRGREPEDRLCASHWLDGPAKLRNFQTSFWKEVGQRFGLERGESSSSRKHIPQKEMYRIANNVETIVANVVESIPAIKSSESEATHHENIQNHLTKHLAALAEAAKQAALTQIANRAAAAANQKREEEQRLRKNAEEDRDRALHEAAKIRRENQDRLRDLPVPLVLKCVMGVVPSKEGNQWVFETPAAKIVVAADERRFSIFKNDRRGGSGAISAVMLAVDCTFLEAVRWLAAHFSQTQVESTVRIAYEKTIRKTASNAVADPISLAEKLEKFAPNVEANWASVREYLVRDRCLPGTWIDNLHKRGHVWSNEYRSACFGHRDLAGSLVGASVRGTTSRFFQTIGDKKDGFFRLRLSQNALHRIAVVESPIEALSLASLIRDPNTIYASSAGAGGLEPMLELARRYKLEVLAAQNNDAGGDVQARLTADACRSHRLIHVRVKPAFNDWNDALRFLHNEMRNIVRDGSRIVKRLRSAWRESSYNRQPFARPPESGSLLPEATENQGSTLNL